MSTLDNPFGAFMDTVGDQSGSIEQGIDGSTTPVEFKFVVAQGTVFVAEGVIQYVREKNIAPTGLDGAVPFASGPTIPLTNGILLEVRRIGGAVLDLFSGEPIKEFSEWAQHGTIVKGYEFRDKDITDALSCNWAFRTGIRLGGGDQMVMTVQDDLSDLDVLRTKIDGYFEQPTIL